MVNIVTGPIDSGKTSRLERLHRELGSGDGFLLRKRYAQGRFAGQRIERISTGEALDFSCILPGVPAGWNEALRYGPFSFSTDGLAYAETIAREALRAGAKPIFIDEIGPLELEGKCFDGLLRLVLAAHAELYIAARDSCLLPIIDRYGLAPAGYRVIVTAPPYKS